MGCPDRGLPAQVPQEALLCYPLGNPADDAFLDAAEPALGLDRLVTAALAFLRGMQHHGKPMP